MTRTGIAILILTAATWAEDKKLTLQFLDGNKQSYVLTGFDKDGLNAKKGDAETHIAWNRLAPESAYRAREELTHYLDGPGLLALAEFAVALELYPEGLKQLEVAFALGAMEEAAFEKREAEIKALEVDFLCKRIDRLLKTGREPRICLSAIKRLKERYPEHANNQTYEAHVKRLVEQLAKQAEKKQAEQAQKVESKELAGLRKVVEKLVAQKAKALAKADELMQESLPAIEKAQVSRVKKTLVEPLGAERYFKRARKAMRAIAKTDRQFRIVDKAALQKEYEGIEKKLIECYLRVARIQLSQRNYKAAVEYVRDILYYDPIHEEALDMVETIKKNRITFKASDITNARPRVTGG